MKVLYIVPFGAEWLRKNYSGVAQKIESQAAAFVSNGFEIDVMYCDNSTRLLGSLGRRISFLSDGVKWPREISGYQGIYARKPTVCTKGFIRTLARIKENDPSVPVVVEIPTYPYDDQFKSFKSKPALMTDRLWRGKMHLYVDRVVDLYGNKEVFKIQTVSAINGINLDGIAARKPSYRAEEINLLCVASFAKWHGVDRMLSGLHEYYSLGGRRKVVLHLIGGGPALFDLKSQVEEYALQNSVLFHGVIPHDKLDAWFDECCFAIESLADYRRGVSVSNSLKSREYLARGIPFAYSTDIDVFRDERPSSCYRVPSDDSPIDIGALIKFIDDLYLGVPEKEVIEALHCYAVRHVDINRALAEVFEFFRSRQN